jgi:hypothetical protein
MTTKGDPEDQMLVDMWCIGAREYVRSQMVYKKAGIKGGAMINTKLNQSRTIYKER